jgi:hypothetical protein
MKTDLTLNQAIAQYFDIDGRTLPAFTAAKPVLQAREWLTANGHELEYTKGELPKDNRGIVVYSRGGSPMFAVIDGDASALAGSMVHGSITKVSIRKNAKKNDKTAKNAENSQKQPESAPVAVSEPSPTDKPEESNE